MTTEVISTLSEEQQSRLASNWSAVVAGVCDACSKANRDPKEVTIIGVTKYVNASLTAALVDQGCVHIGENRPQVLWTKAEAIQEANSTSNSDTLREPRWHQIGQLQTNKVRRLLRHHPIIHSVDRVRLLDCIVQESEQAGIQTDCLLEINISGDVNKAGFHPSEVETVLRELPQSAVRVRGLMGMAGLGGGPEEANHQFALLHDLRNHLESVFQQPLPELSMGMSGDYEQAIAQGATMVRIGSSIFRGLIEPS